MSRVLSRRMALGALAAAAVPAAALDAEARRAPDPGLAEIAARSGLFFGASITQDALTNAAYGDLYRRETRMITSDVDLKFDWLRPEPGPARFEPADRLVGFAAQHGLLFRGHTLIWNDNPPPWLRALPKHEVAAVFDRHLDEVAGRYAGRIHSWDVVNEPFWPGDRAPGGYRRGPWYDALGPAYVARAFRRVRQADPHAKLVLNEAQTERTDELGLTMRRALLRLVDELLEARVPLDAVGLQGHLQPQYPSDDESFGRFLEDIARRGLDIYITELDVDDSSLPDPVPVRDELVAKRYEAFLARVLAVPAVKVVVTWQLADRYTWYKIPAVLKERRFTHAPRPLPFDDNFAKKPAWHAIARAFRERAV